MTSVCIDGFNLALAQGSGIATYGRNLLQNAHDIGLGTQVLYGPKTPKKKSSVLDEASLVDAERVPTKPSRKEKAVRMRRTFLSRFGRTAHPILPTGEVIWPMRSGGRPVADYFWASQDLYFHAQRCFQTYNAETGVTFRPTTEAPRPDVMHWTCPLPLHAKGVPNIYTFHDLIPLRLPHATLDDKSVFMNLCREAVRRADHIAVVSETTRQDVIRILGVAEDRVTNTYQAVSVPPHLTARPDAEIETELAGVFNLPWKGYFLHFGAVEPKKNLGRVVEAYLASGTSTPLVLIGGRAWLDEPETALLRQIKQDGGPNAERIRQYDYMPFSMLISLIRGAKATLFPSLYEGFGLPVLESMALSTAVLTSTGGSLPEVAGEAAILVDPYDVQAMTRGIKALDQDEALRAHFEKAGKGQAAKFSPAAYQERLKTLYQKVGVTF